MPDSQGKRPDRRPSPVFFSTRPPIRPLSLAVRHRHPPATTLSARPSSAADLELQHVLRLQIIGVHWLLFLFSHGFWFTSFPFLRKVFPETGGLYRSLPDPYASWKAGHISFSERGAGHGKSPAPETLPVAAENNRDRTTWICPGPHICSSRFFNPDGRE